MATLEKVRNDLKTIRLYYSSKEKLDKAFKLIQNRVTEDIISTYTRIIENAPLEIYMLFIELYVNGSTQENAAYMLGYSVDYIRKKNAQLLKYILTKIKD